MDSVVTEDQRMVLDTSVRFIEASYPLAKVRAGAFADGDQREEYLRATAALARPRPDAWSAPAAPALRGVGSH